jgi:hypothetical protein
MHGSRQSHACVWRIPNSSWAFVFLPQQAPWLEDYLHEVTTFPGSKHDDQADSTAQALAWINSQPQNPAIFEYYRREIAKMLASEGRPVEYIAERINSTPEDVRQWLKEAEQAKTEAQNRLRELECRLTKHCGKCGGPIPPGVSYVSGAGEAYHEICWQKKMNGF